MIPEDIIIKGSVLQDIMKEPSADYDYNPLAVPWNAFIPIMAISFIVVIVVVNTTIPSHYFFLFAISLAVAGLFMMSSKESLHRYKVEEQEVRRKALEFVTKELKEAGIVPADLKPYIQCDVGGNQNLVKWVAETNWALKKFESLSQ